MHRGHAKGEICIKRPVFFWGKSVAESSNMGVCIYDTGHNSFAFKVVDFRLVWDIHFGSCAHRNDPISFNQDASILDHLLAIHRDNAGVGEGDLA